MRTLWWMLLAASLPLVLAWKPLAKASREWRAKAMFDGESGLRGDGWWGETADARTHFDREHHTMTDQQVARTQRHAGEAGR